jgi:hypothetical protein
MCKTKTTLQQAWDELDRVMRVNSGECMEDSNIDSHPHSLFIELHDGDLCNTWVFPTQAQSLSALSTDEVRYALSLFDDTGYLISLHTRDDIEDYG